MAQRFDIPFTPGGLNTDVVENKIGYHEYTELENLKLNKVGEFINHPGYEALKSGLSSVRSGFEVTDDLSGDRFILYHSGSSLYRIDYDDGDGNGYENETPYTLTLPSGVTLTSSDDLKYRWYQGVLWILGASHPMRYEYVERSIFEDSEEEIDDDTFASSTESWSGSSATVARTSGGVPSSGGDTWHLQVTQTGVNGAGRQTYSISEGESYVLRAWVKGSGTKVVNCGSSAGASDYGTDSSSDTNWRLIEIEFTATGSTLYVSFIPHSGGSSSVGDIDNIRLYQKQGFNWAAWKLSNAHIEDVQGSNDYYTYLKNSLSNELYDGHNLSFRGVQVFDKSQYSLPFALELNTSGTMRANNESQSAMVEIIIEKQLLLQHPRLTGFALLGDVENANSGTLLSLKKMGEIVDFTSELQDVDFTHGDLSWQSATPEALFLHKLSDTCNYGQHSYFAPGNILHLSNSNGETDLVILSCRQVTSPDTPIEGVNVEGDVSPLLSGSADQDLPPTSITIKRKIIFTDAATDYYTVWATIDAIADPDYYDLTGFPPGVSDITFDYKDKVIVNGRAVALSTEDGEEDVIRYSPPYQYDVFPSTFYGQTEIGDSDSNIAIEAMDDRVIVCKRKSFSKFQVNANGVSQDIGIARRGLYADNGLIVIDGLAYFMDENDVYVFDGVRVRSFLNNSKVRNQYKDNVNTSSFFLFNKLDNELWLRIGSIILAYQFDYDNWYTIKYSSTVVLPSYWWLDADNKLIGGRTSTLQDYNHGLSTTSAAPDVKFVTRLVDTDNPEQLKKLFRYVLYCQSSGDVTIKITDLDSGESHSVTMTPSSTEVKAVEDWTSKFFF